MHNAKNIKFATAQEAKQICRYKIAYTDACTTHYNITVYTTVFLKMNPRFRNMQKTSKN